MKSNSKVLSDAFNKVEELVREQMRMRFINAGFKFLYHAWENREFQSFTGNTITSYAIGVYENGTLFDMYLSVDGMIRPLMRKIGEDNLVYLERPYEGDERAVRGRVDVDNEYGYEESRNFLQNYRPKTKGYVLVVTTGTEYSEYLENELELNVLTDTQLSGRAGLVNSIIEKPML